MTSCLRAAKKVAGRSFSSRAAQSITLALLFALTLGASAALADNALPFINSPLVPGQKAPGAAAFTLTVNGTGFVSGATVNWNGNARTTTFVSSSQLTATINASDLTTAGTAQVTVSNPAPGGGVSNPASFQVVKNGYTVAFSRKDYNTANSPQDVAVADFDRDGKSDLAVANSSNSVSILLGNGDGTFKNHVDYSDGGHPIAIALGDFNGDGKVDVVTVDEFVSSISILLGNGDGTLQNFVQYSTGNHPVALATGDFNKDGKLDVAVADIADGKIAILLGNGDGTFRNHVDYACGNGPSGVAVGDFNADGKLDLAVADNSDNTVAILLGNGDGTFQAPIPFPTATVPNSVITADFNGDGKLDLAVGTSNVAVSVLIGNGDGTFQNHKEYTIGANSVIVAAADLSSDGRPDLISANFNDNTVSTLVSNADGTFKSQSVFATNGGPSGVAVGDFNKNGKLDIAVASANSNTVSVLSDSLMIVSPGKLSFGTQTSGFGSAAKTVTLTNKGTTSYTVPALVWSGASYTDFSQTTTCGSTLAAGASCTYSVVFTPTASENANAIASLTSSDGSSIGFEATGTGNIPISLNPRNISFPYQLLGTTSAPKTATFTNKSGVPITFTAIQLEGINQNAFNLTHNCPLSPSTLAAGASCTATITYSPKIIGGETTTLVFYGNFTLQKQGSLIQGQATAVSYTPTSLTFPSTPVGTTSAPMTVTFTNAGSDPLPITSVTFSGANNDFAQTNTCGGSVAGNSSCTFSVTFTPSGVGTRTANMNIGDSDPTGPQVVKLTGTGQ